MRTLKSALLTALTFAATGPLFGTLAYAAMAFMQGGTDGGSAALATLWMLPFGYMLGLAPAAAAGAAVGAVGGRLPGPAYLAAGAVLGFLIAGSWGYFDAEPRAVSEGVINLALIGGFAGLLSAGVSLLLRRDASGRRAATA